MHRMIFTNDVLEFRWLQALGKRLNCVLSLVVAVSEGVLIS